MVSLFLTEELIFTRLWINIHINRCAVLLIFITHKKKPPRSQNVLPADEYPKQGCPAPLHSAE